MITKKPFEKIEITRRDFCKLSAGSAGMAILGGLGIRSSLGASFEANELVYLSASELLPLFRSRKLSPVEVLNAQITHSNKTEPKINCLAFKYFEEAMIEAKASEQRYMKGRARTLEGITLTVKDEHNITGKITTNGSLIRKNDVAKSTHPMVQRMIDAGCVILGRTTTPEFSMAWVTWNKIHGVTRNPWNLYYCVGGSSGGAGASLASGIATLATGSDIGGSIRLPASINGLYGFYPPFGRNPSSFGRTLIPQAADGPMARTFDDLILFQNTITGPHPYQMESLLPPISYPAYYAGIKGIRIAYSMDYDYKVIDPDVRKNTEIALALLEELGAIVEPVSLGFEGDKVKAAWIGGVLAGSAGGTMIKIAAGKKDLLTDYARLIVETIEKVGPADVATADALTWELNKKLQDAVFLAGYDALIAPTWAGQGERADYDDTKHTPVIDGQEVDPILGPIMTPEFNVLNRYPVITAPSGRARNNIPTGIQIIANGYDDLMSFRIAAAYSRIAPPLYIGNVLPDYRDSKS